MLVLIAHNLRSAHNVGSLLRSAEGLGVDMVYLTGYTPYPFKVNDNRLPHISTKISKRINKTALGAETLQAWERHDNLPKLIKKLSDAGLTIVALEQTPTAINLELYNPSDKIALIVGREVEGIEAEILDLADAHLQIPMAGSKESFNVAVAAAIAMHQLKLKRNRQ